MLTDKRQRICCRALLDIGSSMNLITRRLVNSLGIRQTKCSVTIGVVAVLVDKNHNGFRPVNPLHKKSCLPKAELIIDPTTLGGYRSLIRIRRYCRDHSPSSQLLEKPTIVNKVESSAPVGTFREHLRNSNPNAFRQLRRI